LLHTESLGKPALRILTARFVGHERHDGHR
jgi:hypothetical protein